MNRSINGALLRQFIIGALYEYMQHCQMPVEGSGFDRYVDDTCNKVHRYLRGEVSPDASFSDVQCTIAFNAKSLFI